MPVTIPASPLRYTLAYLIHSDDAVIAVDPGWDSDAGWQDLLAGLAAAGISPDRVTGVVVTHVHPDHHGLSARLREASGAWIAMHAAEIKTLPARVWQAGSPAARPAQAIRRSRGYGHARLDWRISSSGLNMTWRCVWLTGSMVSSSSSRAAVRPSCCRG